jgi:hypothetical protein
MLYARRDGIGKLARGRLLGQVALFALGVSCKEPTPATFCSRDRRAVSGREAGKLVGQVLITEDGCRNVIK